jgi:hypothetical protein
LFKIFEEESILMTAPGYADEQFPWGVSQEFNQGSQESHPGYV